MTQNLESVSERYSCEDLLIDDRHHLSKILVQKQALSCESQIEKSYYNNDGRTLKLKKICIYCGEEGGEGFLLDTAQLQKRCLTRGYSCYPICVGCLDSGKKVLTHGKQHKQQERKEKQQKEAAKKAATAAGNKK